MDLIRREKIEKGTENIFKETLAKKKKIFEFNEKTHIRSTVISKQDEHKKIHTQAPHNENVESQR